MTERGTVQTKVHRAVLAAMGDNWEHLLAPVRESASEAGGRLLDEDHPRTKAEGDLFVMEWDMERIAS